MARFLLLVASLVCLSVYFANAKTVQQYRTETLNAFNAYRRSHGLSQVSQSSTLNNLAQSWAKTGHSYIKNTFNGGNFVWELIFTQYGQQLTGATKLINAWASGNTKNTMDKKGFSKMGFGVHYKNNAYHMVGMWQ